MSEAAAHTCVALQQRRNGPLLGSAPQVDVFVYMECRRPWPSKVEKAPDWPVDIAAAADRAGEVAGLSVRTQAWPSARAGDEREVRIYRRGAGGLVTLVKLRLQGSTPPPLEEVSAAVTGELPGSPAPPALFVCTHGSRDACCGRLGFPIIRRARQLSRGREILESSHLGGHRYAPTILALPEWRLFGSMTEDEVEPFLDGLGRRRPFVRRMRGACWLSPPAQAAEGAVLGVLPNLGDGIRVVSTESEGTTHRIVLELQPPGAPGLRYLARIEEIVFQGIASCRDIPGGEMKAMSEYEVVELEPLEP